MVLKKTIFILLGLAGFLPASAQYYYQDIYRTEETNRQHQQYRDRGIREIDIKSFDAQNSPSSGFQCKKTFTDDYGKTFTETRSFSTGEDLLISFFDKEGRVRHTVDSSSASINHTWIHYGPKGEIDSLIFLSYAPKKTGMDTLLQGNTPYKLRETHSFHYDSDGLLEKMERFKNHRSAATILFTRDSAGRVFKEYEKHSNRPIYYYKYQEDGLLSDVFHYNHTKKRMVPDFMFNYDDEGRLIQKTVVLRNSHDYLRWEYAYDQAGNIHEEKCYNKKEELQGSLLFRYK